MFSLIVGITVIFQNTYFSIKQYKRRYTSKRGRGLTLEEQTSFKQSTRYDRRGIVFSTSMDQMESVVMGPNKEQLSIFRLAVQSENSLLSKR